MNLTTSESGTAVEAATTTQAVTPTTNNSLPPSSSFLDKPPVIVEPTKSWVALNLRDLWAYRELLYFLTWRDVKVRYKQTLLGASWALLQPLFLMLIATFIFGRVAGMEHKTGGIPYPLFAFAGLLPWTFFSNSLNNGGNSLVGSANLITKVYFPRLIVPAAAVAAGMVDFLIAAALLLVLMVAYRMPFTLSLAMLLPLMVLLFLLALGMGLWLSALNVKYRDIRHALPFLIQAGIYISPVFYASAWIAPRWQWLINLNPLTGIIDNFRAALFHRAFNWTALGISTAITIAFLVYAAYAFRRMEKSFADVV